MTPELKASLIILTRIKNQLNNAADAMRYLMEKKGEVINGDWNFRTISNVDTGMFGLISYSFIWYAAFLDEYTRHFKSKDPGISRRISQVKKECKKYIDNIGHVFGDVKAARNKVLAHNYRDKQGNPLSNSEINQHFNQVIQYASMTPYLQISNIVGLILEEVEKEFGELSEDEISLIESELDQDEE